MHTTSRSTSAALAVLAVLVAAPAAAQLTLWAAEATTRVPKDATPEDKNAVYSAEDATVRLRAARGESEAFHLVVTAGGALRNVEVRAGDLEAVDGDSGGSAVGREHLFLYREAYFNVTRPSASWGQPNHGRTGKVPDALIPFVDPYGSVSNEENREIGIPFNVGRRRSQPLFVLVEVPADAAAGVYRNELELVRRSDGRVLRRLTFELEVLDVTLPKRPAFQAFYNLDAGTLAELHGNPGPGRLQRITRNALDELARRRVSPGYVYPKVPSYDNDTGFDWSGAEEEWSHWLDTWESAVVNVGFIWDDGAERYRIQRPNGAPYTRADLKPDSHFDRQARRFYARLRDDLEARGWADRAVVFMGYDDRGALADEPYNEGKNAYARLRAWEDIVQVPETDDFREPLPFVVAGDSLYPNATYSDLRGTADVWDHYVDEVELNAAAYAERAAMGEQVWLVANAYADFIDYPSVYHRSLGFLAWKTGATGMEHWDTMAWFDARENLVSPWTPANLTAVWGWGGGALMWPGENVERRGIRIDGPLPSLRLELNRQAFEDYDLLALLAASGGDGPALADAIAHAALPSRLYDGLEVQRGHFEKSRDAVLDLLVNGGETRTITGRLSKSNGQPIAGALVSDGTFAARTGEDGRYVLVRPSGDVTLTASADGYAPLSIDVGASASGVDLVLEKLAVQVKGLFGSFERNANLWDGDGVNVRLSAERVRHGTKSMRVLFKASAEDPGIYPDTGLRPRDWSSFDAFVVEVYNASPYLAELDMILYDTRGREAFQIVTVNPESWRTVRWPVASMTGPFDVTKVAEMEIYVDAGGRADKVVFFDRMRLVRDQE
jgi:hypothetical protein